MQKLFFTLVFVLVTTIAFAQSTKSTPKTTVNEAPKMEVIEIGSVSRGATQAQATMATLHQKAVQKLNAAAAVIEEEEEDTDIFPSNSAEDNEF